MRLEVQVVTPELARKWLKANIGNRSLRSGTVAKYADDMYACNWERKPVAICFDQDGHLGNGQHTLSAIAKSGISQEMLVAWDVPRRAIAFMDMGARRTINDIAQFVGASIDSPRSAAVGAMITRCHRDGKNKTGYSFSRLLEEYQKHYSAIEFAFSFGGSSRTTGVNAITRAVVARAWYRYGDNARLHSFLETIKSGVADGNKDLGAIRLRDFFLAQKHLGGHARAEAFEKATSALNHFMLGNPVTKLYGTSENLYPLPGE